MCDAACLTQQNCALLHSCGHEHPEDSLSAPDSPKVIFILVSETHRKFHYRLGTVKQKQALHERIISNVILTRPPKPCHLILTLGMCLGYLITFLTCIYSHLPMREYLLAITAKRFFSLLIKFLESI